METQEPEVDLPSYAEKALVTRFAELTDAVNTSKAYLAGLQEDLDKVEAELMQLMDDLGKKCSAKYNGIGHVTNVEPAPFASTIPGEEEKLFAALRAMGREDLVKLSVHSGSLTTLVRQCLKDGTPIPEGAKYYVKRRLQFFPIKK
jgi:hypothetical protein